MKKPVSFNEIALRIGASTDSRNVVCGIAVDSRLLKKGDVFFALPGSQVDGHAFLQAAAFAGASGAVVRKDYKGPNFGLPLIYVADVLESLQQLARSHLSMSKASIVAVTGSLGKTTTKGFIATLLSHRFKVSASPGNSNSQIGLPLAILNHTSQEDEIIILEMGMTQPGQISKLIEIAPPDLAVVTKVALVHAENFDSIEAIAEAKAEIFRHPSTKLGIYHRESDFGQILSRTGNCKKQSFSLSDLNPNLPLLPLLGAHNLHNFSAAAAVARWFGMEWEDIQAAQSSLTLPERRLETVEKQGILFVNDSYNASEESMKAALDSLPQPKIEGRRVAFFGGMVELGKFSERCHWEVGKYALEHVDLLFCFGEEWIPVVEEWKRCGRLVFWTKEREGLVPFFLQHIKPGDVVLLKGSRAKGVWKILEAITEKTIVNSRF